MNKQELEKALITLGVHPRNYTLSGLYKDSSWIIEPTSVYEKRKSVEMWSVFNFERGIRFDEKKFNNEDEACDYIYEKLKKHQELVIKFKLKS